jgi:hypothetical protein
MGMTEFPPLLASDLFGWGWELAVPTLNPSDGNYSTNDSENMSLFSSYIDVIVQGLN